MGVTSEFLGIGGLSVGAAGTWALAIVGFFSLVAWWIRGMPERRRAETEHFAGSEAATAAQWARFQGEINRLLERVKTLENRVEHLEQELEETRASEAQARRDEADARARLIHLEAVQAGLGQARMEGARTAAAERIIDDARRDK